MNSDMVHGLCSKQIIDSYLDSLWVAQEDCLIDLNEPDYDEELEGYEYGV